ncbi:hypothetical protein LTR91_003852 [Friedmanniomyces endolithicus]|uniref:NADP-dependent oxidoreductase domain-containing protein n=1 Tax=Friedmanniomyces endolithicus TaxID=329885 RepID=A0AAN6JB27_9PEZI|nr:hypothetical protein LTS00_004103 [Friedmanniomyces endolithicus]KAK0323027.1 hypothetical protein LTR82_005957 [Friedmanniomyces endolithicus]KAK0927340.1 hypothetical protein LTR57_003503 [Friedmanniomyces endolithicus]KAK0959769.1 hypothetical protein LTS01_021231 [Friedmanniomyces endolithicus]KAK1005927.1 hypothetical protein LTR91_003852 [Friedmanniomyces endolithicus]
MVKIVVGLMGSSVSSGSTSMTGAEQLRPFLSMLKKHNVRELDTARVYNSGKSEEDVGNVAEAKNDFIIATKAPGFSPGSLAYQKVIDNCNASLKALKQDSIALYYFHGPDRKTPLEESCKAIDQLHKECKIAKFGVSNFSAQEVEEVHSICSSKGWITPSVYQGMYNPLSRTGEQTLFPTLRKLGMAFYAFSPLAGGYFSKSDSQLRTPTSGGRMDQMKHFANMFVNDLSLAMHDHLTQTCEKEGLTVKEAALRWLFHHSILGAEDRVILGGSSTEQMEENVEACEGGPLPERVVECFEKILPAMTKTSLAQTPLVGSSASQKAGGSESNSSAAKDMGEKEGAPTELQRQASDGAASLVTPVHEHAVGDDVSHDVTPPPPRNKFPKSFQRFKILPTASQYVSARTAAEAPKKAGAYLPPPPDRGA